MAFDIHVANMLAAGVFEVGTLTEQEVGEPQQAGSTPILVHRNSIDPQVELREDDADAGRQWTAHAELDRADVHEGFDRGLASGIMQPVPLPSR